MSEVRQVRQVSLKQLFVFFWLLAMSVSQVVFGEGLGGFIGFGYGNGGDSIGKFNVSTGDSETLRANEGLAFYGGLRYEADDLFAVKSSLGFKFDSISADNGDAYFDRTIFETLLFLKVNQHYLGGGFTYHSDVTFECDLDGFFGCDFTADLENTLGYVIAYEYLVQSSLKKAGFILGARYNDLEYEYKEFGFEKMIFDASGFDIYAEMIFKL